MEQNHDGHIGLLKQLVRLWRRSPIVSLYSSLTLLTNWEVLNLLEKTRKAVSLHETAAPIEMGGGTAPHHRVTTNNKKPRAKTAAMKPRFVERGLVASVLSSSIMSDLINFWIGEALPLLYPVLQPTQTSVPG
jgi:hypothetical protein